MINCQFKVVIWGVYLLMLSFSVVAEPITVEFESVQTKLALEALAEFSDYNVVIVGEVDAPLTIHLKDVEFEQAIEKISSMMGLEVFWESQTVIVASQAYLETQALVKVRYKEAAELSEPLTLTLIPIHYAKAQKLVDGLRQAHAHLLSQRGSLMADERANIIIIQDTPKHVKNIESIVNILDRPVDQVMIEAYIIKAKDSFERALGARLFGGTTLPYKPEDGAPRRHADRLQFSFPDLPANIMKPATLGMTVAQLPGDFAIHLELSALEDDGVVKIMASPQLMTMNQSMAYIESGEEIPFDEYHAEDKIAHVSFKKAVLRLEITPQITPDDQVILSLTMNQDARGRQYGHAVGIDKQAMHTCVAVKNNHTLVLGGIVKHAQQEQTFKVPGLSRLPWVGALFRYHHHINQKEKLFIFVTPKIVRSDWQAET